MKNKISFVLMPFTLAVLMLFASGCQKQAEMTNSNATNVPSAPTNPPYSTGPTEPPSVKGPTSAPPTQDSQVTAPEAVTAKENIRLTLPIKQK